MDYMNPTGLFGHEWPIHPKRFLSQNSQNSAPSAGAKLSVWEKIPHESPALTNEKTLVRITSLKPWTNCLPWVPPGFSLSIFVAYLCRYALYSRVLCPAIGTATVESLSFMNFLYHQLSLTPELQCHSIHHIHMYLLYRDLWHPQSSTF